MISSARKWIRTGLFVSLVAMPAAVFSADRGTKNLRKPNPADRTVEMFAAINSDEIEVRLIPKDDTESRVLIKNKTKKPLNVKLPAAFAGVPVLAQNLGGARGGRGGAGGAGGGGQSMGGGMGGGMMGGGGMGGGMFNVAPEQVGQFKVATVCLEHGKKEPRPQIPYVIAPLDTVTTKPGVKELLVAMGRGRLNQRATQVAAWHLANGLTWQQLATKRIEHLNGTSEPWFSPQEIQAGMRLAQAAMVEAQKNPPESPGESPSLSEISRAD
jgi:hypothetical protein